MLMKFITYVEDLLSFSPMALCLAIGAIICISCLVKALGKPGVLLPPGPRGLPIVGYIPFLGTQLHLTFTKLGHLYGPIYKFWLGNKICVVLSSPELVKEVVRDLDRIFANRDSTVASLIVTYGGINIGFQDCTPEWRKMRRIFAHKMLGKSTLDSSFVLRQEAAKKSMQEIYEKSGSSVHIGQVGTRTVISSIVAMIWGDSTDAADGENELQGFLADIMVLVGVPNVSDFFPILSRLDLQGVEAKTKKVFSLVDQLFDHVIARKQGKMKDQEDCLSAKGSSDLLQYLMELNNSKDSTSSLSIPQVKAMLMDIAVGATDTTSTMLEWTMSELLLHPQALKIVQEELEQVVGLHDLVNETHLSRLRYLDAVVKETQRLHPAFPLLVPRRPSQATEVGGYHIPEGAKVFINVYAMQRDSTLWDNPLEFKPERFLDDTSGTKLDYSGNDMKYLPFGSGRRACPGIPLAERSLIYILASFLHCFNWQVPKGVNIDLEGKFGIVVRKKEPLVAIPTPRLSNLKNLYA